MERTHNVYVDKDIIYVDVCRANKVKPQLCTQGLSVKGW